MKKIILLIMIAINLFCELPSQRKKRIKKDCRTESSVIFLAYTIYEDACKNPNATGRSNNKSFEECKDSIPMSILSYFSFANEQCVNESKRAY